MDMDVASANKNPKQGYPVPDVNLAVPRFAYNVPPCSPSYQYQDQPLPPQPAPIFRTAMLPEQRRRHVQNNNSTNNAAAATTSSSSSSHDRTQKILIGCIVFFFIVAMISIPVMLFYIFGPHSPTFSIEKVCLQKPIFYNSATRFSSLFNITMKVNNPSKHIDILYEHYNSIVATYSGIRLCSGGIPQFFQPPKDETLIQSVLTGIGVVLPNELKQKLENNKRNRRIPFRLNMMNMVRFKMGSVTLRALLKVSCDIVLDNLENPKLISSSCDSSAGFWFNAITN